MKQKITALYLVAFFLSLHIALPAYVNSTFLSNFVAERFIGIIYTIGSILTIIIFAFVPQILTRFGNFKVAVTILGIETLAVVSLAITQNPIFIIIAFIGSISLIRVAAFNSDVFLESLSTDSKTGGIRGFFFSSSNVAWVASPVLAGFILGDDNYTRLYALTALAAIPVIIIFFKKFSNFKDPAYDHFPFWKTLKIMMNRDGIRKIFLSNIMLRFFYSWMVIYTPIYLHEHIGFSWGEIGLIFSIMLVPFVVLGIPLGKIADKYIGEKELLSLGIVIVAVSTAYLSFVDSSNFLVWALVLLVTRIGASMVDIMSETYFFKKIDGSDSNLLGFFRMTGPIAFIIGPLLATLVLPFVGIKYLFLVLGILMLWGLRYSLTLKDTL